MYATMRQNFFNVPFDGGQEQGGDKEEIKDIEEERRTENGNWRKKKNEEE